MIIMFKIIFLYKIIVTYHSPQISLVLMR